MTGNVGSSSTSSGGNSGDERWYDLTSFVEFRVHLEFKIVILRYQIESVKALRMKDSAYDLTSFVEFRISLDFEFQIVHHLIED